MVALAVCSIESSAADPAAEVAALHAVDQTWVKGYNANDVDTVAGLYDEDAVLLPPGAPAIERQAAIRAFFAKGGKWLYVRDTWNSDGAPAPPVPTAPPKK